MEKEAGVERKTISLPRELYQKLNEYCEKTGLKYSTVITKALEKFLEEKEK